MVHTVVPVLLVVKHLVFIIECATFGTKRPYHRQICRESEIPVNPSLRSRSMNRAGGTRCNEWSDSNMCMDSFRCTSMPGGRGHHRWLIVLFLEFEATSTIGRYEGRVVFGRYGWRPPKQSEHPRSSSVVATNSPQGDATEQLKPREIGRIQCGEMISPQTS